MVNTKYIILSGHSECYGHERSLHIHKILVSSSCKPLYRTPSINAQCQSMPIKILALIPMSINSDQCWSIALNSNQCFTDVLIWHWSALRGMDLNRSALICNDRHWDAFRINAMILIGIDRHWLALGIDRGSLDCSTTQFDVTCSSTSFQWCYTVKLCNDNAWHKFKLSLWSRG